MELIVETVADMPGVTVVLVPLDRLDAGNANRFKEAMMPHLTDGVKQVIDLSQVRFMDSSGLGALLSCMRRLNSAGGELKLCNLQKPVRVLMELVRMHRVFDIYETREQAVQAFGKPV